VRHHFADNFGDSLEVNPTLVNVFSDFRKESCKEEHDVVEGIETMPEGRGQEYNQCFVGTRPFTLGSIDQTVLNVELEPEMDLVVPALQHYHAGVRSFYSHNVHSNNLIPFVGLCLLINTVVRQTTSLDSTVGDQERGIVEAPLGRHSDIVEDNFLPER
jgi:hypothetical protein